MKLFPDVEIVRTPNFEVIGLAVPYWVVTLDGREIGVISPEPHDKLGAMGGYEIWVADAYEHHFGSFRLAEMRARALAARWRGKLDSLDIASTAAGAVLATLDENLAHRGRKRA